ncbi:MAG: hypothetical protein CL820_11275 [Croceicoccus sp.]|nr:hypothetical protein [Croceicoccus sp.]MAL26452.1 hypothetical protein [Croceicoccus sp.]
MSVVADKSDDLRIDDADEAAAESRSRYEAALATRSRTALPKMIELEGEVIPDAGASTERQRQCDLRIECRNRRAPSLLLMLA